VQLGRNRFGGFPRGQQMHRKIFAPMIGYKRNASEGGQSQQSDARTDKPSPRLVAFRAVYVFGA
jgi:hypothetical protein